MRVTTTKLYCDKGGLKMTVYCDYDSCEYYEDGCCYNDRIFLSGIGECESYRQKIEENENG